MKSIRLLSVVYFLVITSGCQSIDGPALGDGLSFKSGWSKLQNRYSQTLRDRQFWMPLAAAVAIQIDDFDEHLSDQLREHQPLFGSTDHARQASDDLKALTQVAYITTAIAAPTNNQRNWLGVKSQLLLTEWLGVETTSAVTNGLKSASDRQRPDASDRRSFPSGHASKATAQAQFAIFNSHYLPIEQTTRSAMAIGFNSLAIGTAWARVEAGKHYPSDVLAGWSLGYLVSQMTTVFIDDKRQSRISASYFDQSLSINYQMVF